MILILVLFFTENFSRGGAKYHQPSEGHKPIPKIDLHGKKSYFPITFCSLLFFFSFIFPTLQMAYWTLKFPKYFQDINLWELNLNTVLLVIIASLILLIFSF